MCFQNMRYGRSNLLSCYTFPLGLWEWEGLLLLGFSGKEDYCHHLDQALDLFWPYSILTILSLFFLGLSWYISRLELFRSFSWNEHYQAHWPYPTCRPFLPTKFLTMSAWTHFHFSFLGIEAVGDSHSAIKGVVLKRLVVIGGSSSYRQNAPCQ